MPLRIPTGFCVRWNALFEAEHPSVDESEDLLWLQEVDAATGDARTRFIDLGWYGNRASGTFRLAMLDGDWSKELRRFESTDRASVVAELERWLREA